MNPSICRPEGAPSLSPGQRPGYAGRIIRRPVGPRSAGRNAPADRTPLGRTDLLMTLHPARRAGLRNHGPLARNAATIPPMPLQRKFAWRVAAVEALKAQRASLAELDAFFATLQHSAFRGEL